MFREKAVLDTDVKDKVISYQKNVETEQVKGQILPVGRRRENVYVGRSSIAEEGMRRKKRMQCHRGAKAQGKWEHIPDLTTRDWLTLTMVEAVTSDITGILGEKEH